jgi:hypothetical protein
MNQNQEILRKTIFNKFNNSPLNIMLLFKHQILQVVVNQIKCRTLTLSIRVYDIGKKVEEQFSLKNFYNNYVKKVEI